MKKILGSFFIIFNLFAKNYEINISNSNPYLKEPTLLDLKYFEKDIEEIDWINFSPKKSKNYKIKLISKKNIKGGYQFLYLLFPLKENKIKIDYILELKKAPFEEIQQKILGTGYEQTKTIEGKIFKYEVKPTILNVKPVKSVDLYGEFNIDVTIDKNSSKEYEPIILFIHIKGVGYPPNIKKLVNINGIKVLKDKPIKNIKFNKNGAKIDYIYQYALISNKSFIIPSITLKEFNFKEYKLLKTKPIKIDIIKSKNLIDKEDYPPKIEPIYIDIVSFFKYLSIFLFGVLSGILIYILFRKEEYEKILKAKDKKELLSYLVAKYPNSFEEIKKELDIAIVENKNINLFKLKKDLIKKIKEKNGT